MELSSSSSAKQKAAENNSLLIDIRDTNEYSAEHIEGAIHLGFLCLFYLLQ